MDELRQSRQRDGQTGSPGETSSVANFSLAGYSEERGDYTLNMKLHTQLTIRQSSCYLSCAGRYNPSLQGYAIHYKVSGSINPSFKRNSDGYTWSLTTLTYIFSVFFSSQTVLSLNTVYTIPMFT